MDTIRDSRSAVAFVSNHYQDHLTESFVVIMLDVKGNPLGWHEVSSGTQTESLVHPREVFMPSVREGAVSIIVAHNHPSGDATPSKQDFGVTERLRDAGKLLGIKLLDHIVIGHNSHTSIMETNPETLN